MLLNKNRRFNERRKMNRLHSRTVAFVLFRSAEPVIGKLNDISLFGASVFYFQRNEPVDEVLRMDIFTSDSQFVMKEIPFVIVTDSLVPIEIDLGPIALRKRGLEFDGLSKTERIRLKNFIRMYGLGTGGPPPPPIKRSFCFNSYYE
jgi:hypothetical protein